MRPCDLHVLSARPTQTEVNSNEDPSQPTAATGGTNVIMDISQLRDEQISDVELSLIPTWLEHPETFLDDN